MQNYFSFFIFLIFLAFAWESYSQSQVIKKLEQQKIHGLYNDGDFEGVIAEIQSFMRENKTCGKQDSIFIAKHLAVVYTAMPSNRELGKYFMHQLLKLVPSSDLVDMYVSEEIDRIFEKIRKEYLLQQKEAGRDNAVYQAETEHPLIEKTGGRPDTGETVVSSSPPDQAHSVEETVDKKSPETKPESTSIWKDKRYWMFGGFAVLAVGAGAILLWPERDQSAPHYDVPIDHN